MTRTDEMCIRDSDMGLPGMRHAAYVHSTIAHGMVLSIDASEALALPGVEAVFTADDVPGFLFPTAGHPYSMDPSHGDVADRLLLTKHVRYYCLLYTSCGVVYAVGTFLSTGQWRMPLRM